MTIFADTSFYVGLINPRDESHAAAVEFARRFRGVTLTTEYILVELGNWLSQSGDKRAFISLLGQLRSDDMTIILSAERSLFDRGFGLYSKRIDKDWSLTDCISFVVMRERASTEALTADHHFAQAGFVVLLR